MSTDLNTWLSRKATQYQEEEAIASIHVMAFVDGGVPLPYGHADRWIGVNVYDPETYEIDPVATLDLLAKILQYFTKLDGVKVEKNYDSDFELAVTVPYGDDSITLRYHATRESVCTKRVVGTETVPEKTMPAHTKEIIEWDCEPVSLLARNRDAAGA